MPRNVDLLPSEASTAQYIDALIADSAQPTPPERHCLSPKGWLWMKCRHGTDVLVPLKCGHCDPCLERRRAKHIARIIYAVNDWGPGRTLELTSRPRTPWPVVMRAFSNLLRRIRQIAPATQYAAAKEEGPDTGMKHLHVVLINSGYLPQSKLSAWWNHYLGAPVVYIRKITSNNAAYYAAKHVTKEAQRQRNPVTYSRGFPSQPFRQELIPYMRIRRIPDWLSLTHQQGWGMIIGQHAPGCDCFPDAQPIHDGERIWLDLHSARWLPP